MTALPRPAKPEIDFTPPQAGLEKDAPFDVIEPVVQSAPVLIASPHSGRNYPKSFIAQSRLDGDQLRSSEDSFVDELFLSAPSLGVPLIRANFPRAYVDVNREPYELDPEMFDGPLPGYANAASRRVAGGLGTIPRVVADNQEIYRARLSFAEAEGRIEHCYHPYHRALEGLLVKTRKRFGMAVLIDCHSMPPLAGYSRNKPDIILGDRYGATAAPWLVIRAERMLQQLGYRVSRNVPYAGGFTTQNYGRPEDGLHALQIEIDRDVYMTPGRRRKRPEFARLQADLTGFMEQFFTSLNSDSGLATRADYG